MTHHLRDFIRRHVVATVPDEMDLCLSCKQPACTAVAFRQCAHRLQRLEDLRAGRPLPPARSPDPCRGRE